MRTPAVEETAQARASDASPLRKWRNWQTHQLEGLAVAIPWGFESPLPHQTPRGPANCGTFGSATAEVAPPKAISLISHSTRSVAGLSEHAMIKVSALYPNTAGATFD